MRIRLAWLAVLFGVQLLYFPINRLMTGGVVLITPLDAWIPIWPVWAVPYLASLAWWEASFCWAARRMDAPRYRAFVAAMLVTMLTSYVFYIVYPTYVIRPEVTCSGWSCDLVRLVYAHDRLYNAFPSGHAYTTLLIAFFWWDWQPRLRWLWVLAAGVVILSTLFTGQHHLPDPLGGLAWACLGYRGGSWWSQRATGA
ncbi:MAG: phosphatase PAP2 family protein [Chloroflexota bacterium]